MKKQEEYIPQFNYEDMSIEEKIEKQPQICQKCGKYSISLHKGMCFECRQNEPPKYLKRQIEEEKRKKDKNKLIFQIVLYSISILLLILVFLGVIPLESHLGETVARGAMMGLVGSILISLVTLIRKLFKLLITFFKKASSYFKKVGSSLKNSLNEKTTQVADRHKKQLQKTNRTQNKVVINKVSSADEIKKFKELLDMGVISEEEFNAKKKQLLGL